jgi:hypothetical protein
MSQARSAPPNAAPADYDHDPYAWSLEQARLLRTGQLAAIDAENIAEEILDVGRNEFHILESALCVLLMHILKWDHQPGRRSRSWVNTIAEQRRRAVRQLRDNPSLKTQLEEAVEEGYEAARLRASSETGFEPDHFPEACPYSWDDILNRPFKRADAGEP